MSFPEGFFWGGDISAAQIEGGWDQDGKSPVEADYLLAGDKNTMRYAYYRTEDGQVGKVMQHSGQLPPGAKYIMKEDEIYPNHTASDFYHHYKEDIALLAEMNFKALNLSLSWARIMPHGIAGGVNQAGIDYYRNVLKELRKYKIEPVVILHKYDMPAFFLEDCGGWRSRQLIQEYVAFAKVCMKEFKDYVNYWITFNELNVMKVMYDMNPNARPEEAQSIYEMEHNQLIASAKVVRLGHAMNQENKIGCMAAGIFTYPLTSDPKDQITAQKGKQDNFFFFTDIMMRGKYPSYAKRVFAEKGVKLEVSKQDQEDLMEGKADFLAFSYYCTSCITTHKAGEQGAGNLFSGVKNPYLKASDWGWEIDPEGLKHALHELYDRYEKPLFLVENGLGAVDILEEDGTIHDLYRIDYHRQHIEKMREAVEEGVDLLGYTMWSCIDLVSFSSGEMKKRYGFIYVDADGKGNGSFKRYKKDSFYWYQKVCKTNGEDLE